MGRQGGDQMIIFLLGVTLVVVGLVALVIYLMLDEFNVFDFSTNMDDICVCIISIIIIIGVIFCTIGVLIGVWRLGLGFASQFN